MIIGDKLRRIGGELIELADEVQVMEDHLNACQDRICILETESGKYQTVLKKIASAITDELGG